MPLVDVRVPQMGEGLQEVVVVGFHKKPGDTVKRDELLYSMETDKAVMDVESPYDGVVVEWLATEGAVLPIGTPIARLETTTIVPNSPPGLGAGGQRSENATVERGLRASPTPPGLGAEGTTVSPAATGIVIPPRTRALCKQLGISDEEMKSISPATGTKLMPVDVDAYMAARRSASKSADSPVSVAQICPVSPAGTIDTPTNTVPVAVNYEYTDSPLSSQQRVFTSRIRRSAALVIPATMTRPVLWESVCNCNRTQREQDFTFRPTEFQTFAWCVAQASRNHPKLRSTLHGDETVREYAHLNLGIAVGLRSGELVTAVVNEADTLDYRDFVSAAQAAISLAREGKDQADAATQLHLTYMGSYGITEATPLLVAPAIAVMFVGAAYPREGQNWVNLSLTIDHRLINGVEGAKFLKSVVETIDNLDELV